MGTPHKHAIYALAHTDIRIQPFNNQGRTLRITVPCNVAAEELSVRFSNRHGEGPLVVGTASLALCDKKGVLHPDTLVPLTVNGTLSFELPPAGELFSDTIPFRIQPGDTLALNLYYPTNERVTSGNWLGSGALRSRPGNFSADLELPDPGLLSRFARTVITSDMTVTSTTVSQIIAHSAAPARVLGCFGDSITQQSNWTVPLQKLLAHCYPGEISLCNLGISGNRLLAGSPPALGGLNGIAGMDRFEEDLMSLPGLTHAIVELGTNDIGLPGTQGLPDSELITFSQYTDAMTALAARLHERGIHAYTATLAPRPVNSTFTEEREALRHRMNNWLREEAPFDAVLDFDAVLRRPDGKPGMREHTVLPDGLHPSPFGGLLLAKSIDLRLFGGDAVG